MLYVTAPGGTHELRYLPVDWVRIDQPYVFDVDVVASEAHTVALFACSKALWLQVSTDAGASYDPVPTDTTVGVDLGSFTSGERKQIKLKVHIPALTDARTELIELRLGVGT